METQAQRLGYHWGSQFYLIDKKAYHAYLSEIEENKDSLKRMIYLKNIMLFLYDKIKDIDFDAYLETHQKNFKRQRDFNVVGVFKNQIKYDKDRFNSLKKNCQIRMQNFDSVEWTIQSYHYYHELYFYCLTNKTDEVFWFLGEPYHRISREFLEYVEAFSDRWANIFALEGVKLQPVQIGYKEPEKEINDFWDYDIDSDTGGNTEFILPDSALKKLQEILTTNPPTDKRLEEERSLMLDMIERCLSGECYLVMFKL